MSLEVTGPVPPATEPPALVKWIQQNALLSIGITLFFIFKTPYKTKRRKRK